CRGCRIPGRCSDLSDSWLTDFRWFHAKTQRPQRIAKEHQVCYTRGLRQGNMDAWFRIEKHGSISIFLSLFMRKSFLLLLPLILTFAAAANAQKATPTPPPTGDDTGGPTKVFEVRLPVTVSQKKQLITGMTRGDFAIFEDGVQQEITF